MTISERPAQSGKRSPATGPRPFLKWAGGKQRLLPQFEPFFPRRFARYGEPFLGAGAVFFHLRHTRRLPREVYLCDNNRDLIVTYRVVRDRLDDLLVLLARHQERHCEEYYYQVRRLDRLSVELTDVERAARMLYLNRTCFNGLYRVNSKGQFNVPMGRYRNPQILREGVLRAAHASLQAIDLRLQDYTELLASARPGDFLYFDPPYDPVSKTASFTSYTAGRFGDRDQERLARVYAELADRGCLCMLSNSHTPFILDLYRDFRIEIVQANRAINATPDGRGPVQEVVILNY